MGGDSSPPFFNTQNMKRLELFEFEDLNWFPKTIRSGATNLLKVFHKMMGTSDVLVELIKQAQIKVGFNQITDLGSGSGGAMPSTIQAYNSASSEKLSLKLSDKFPNPKVIEEVNGLNIDEVEYISTSVDAAELTSVPEGLKTMIASFHHMSPVTAANILNNAEEKGQPILIYEVAENKMPTLLWWFLLPLSLGILFVMSLIMTPIVRPFSFSQFFWTYIIPIIPIVYAWDGQASLMRTYTFKDIDGLIFNKSNPNYTWEIDVAKKANGKKAGYYIFGYPKTS